MMIVMMMMMMMMLLLLLLLLLLLSRRQPRGPNVSREPPKTLLDLLMWQASCRLTDWLTG
jgi:hypothetical protein